MTELPKYRGEPSMANGDERAVRPLRCSTTCKMQSRVRRPPVFSGWSDVTVDAVGRSLEASEAIHELSVNATSDRSYMTPEGFEAAIRDVRAEAWHQGWVASEAYTGRSAFPMNPYEGQVCGWVPAGLAPARDTHCLTHGWRHMIWRCVTRSWTTSPQASRMT